jgi:hypothetical protein
LPLPVGYRVPYERQHLGVIPLMRHTFVSVLAASGLALAFLPTGASHAQPAGANKAKPTRACGVSAIPLVVGNEWVYQPVGVPGAPPPDPNDAKKYPQRSKKIVIDVVSVETQNAATTVHLTEDIDGRKLDTTITCTADKFDVDPNSFFFAGEPGGAYHVDLSELQHKDGTTLKLVGGKLAGPDWRDDIVATWKQTPTQGATAKLWDGKLEMERHYILAGSDTIQSAAGTFTGAQRVTLDITGRVMLNPPDANPSEFPAGLQNRFWFADGIGIVQVQNSYGPRGGTDKAPEFYGHMYQLTSMKLAK